MSAYILKLNKQFNAIHLFVSDGYEIPAEDKAVIKELHMQWHKKDKYYYTHFSEEKWELLKMTFVGAYKQTKASAKLESEIKAEIKASAKKPQAPVKVTKTTPKSKTTPKATPKAEPVKVKKTTPKATPKATPAPQDTTVKDAIMAAIAALQVAAAAL